MGEKEEKKGKLWNGIKRLMGDEFGEKNEEKDPSNCLSCCDTSAKDDFEEKNEELRDYYQENNELKKALHDLILLYNAETHKNIVNRGKIRQLQYENRNLKYDIFLLKEKYDYETSRLELKLQHHIASEKRRTKARE